jgi:bifunctional UDP-N-acetylglucosamine pyrophosphorylase / glucosamine-1-phosphate N-acetyltransferase
MMKVTAIILAAGQGVRMRSTLPKVLHPLAGKPLIHYSLDIARQISGNDPIVVIGHGGDVVRHSVGNAAQFAVQERQLGTGDAVRAAEGLLGANQTDLVVVMNADMPLFQLETFRQLIALQEQNPGPMSMLTVVLDDPHGFGRVVRNPDGTVAAIVEEAQANAEQKMIRELNVGAYCFRADWLWPTLKRIQLSPKGEYYLTDSVELARRDGLSVQAMRVEDANEAMGINNRIHLAEAEAIMRRRINDAWMMAGVTIIDPASTYIEAEVAVGQDTVIWPNTYLRGKTTVGTNCTLGPNTIIEDSRVGNACSLLNSVLEGAVVENNVSTGPFAHLRKGAHLCEGVHMGNFGEVKDSTLGPGVKMGHFSYIGNATVGSDVNIGAGTVTCNYDGAHKHETVIGKNVFIGSDTMLVAPVTIGDNARTGAGAVVTHDVPAGETVTGVPARVVRKKESQNSE